MHTNKHEFKERHKNAKTKLTTEDTKEHAGESKPKDCKRQRCHQLLIVRLRDQVLFLTSSVFLCVLCGKSVDYFLGFISVYQRKSAVKRFWFSSVSPCLRGGFWVLVVTPIQLGLLFLTAHRAIFLAEIHPK